MNYNLTTSEAIQMVLKYDKGATPEKLCKALGYKTKGNIYHWIKKKAVMQEIIKKYKQYHKRT